MLNKKLIILVTSIILSSCSSLSKHSNNSDQSLVVKSTIEKEEKIVFFDTNKFDLSDESREVLDEKVVTWLTENPKIKVTIEGHCDERGSFFYNKNLGQKRANAVKKYLIENGINSNRIKTVSYSFSKPVALGHNEEAWKQNRRAVTISYSK